MKQVESFITRSNQAQPRPEFVEQTWAKVAQAYDGQLGSDRLAQVVSSPSRSQFWKFRWFFGLPVAIAFALIVMVGIRQKGTLSPTPEQTQELAHDDSLNSLDSDMEKLEAQMLHDPVIDEVLNN